MNWEEAVDSFGEPGALPHAAIEWTLDEWDVAGPRCRAMLHGYVTGTDMRERTERALPIILHLLGEKEDVLCFPDLCALAMDTERCLSVLGEDDMAVTLPALLISTFGGDAAPLYGVVEAPAADPMLRADALLVLAFLVRTHRLPEAAMYEYLASLPERLQPVQRDDIWFGYGRAVAALGFAGLSGRVDQAVQRGLIDPDHMNSTMFWEALRDAQANPDDVSGPIWNDFGPLGSAIAWLEGWSDGDDTFDEAPMEPIRNPLRNIGRNDPCPCGSGKKYKKCCLGAP